MPAIEKINCGHNRLSAALYVLAIPQKLTIMELGITCQFHKITKIAFMLKISKPSNIGKIPWLKSVGQSRGNLAIKHGFEIWP